MLAIYILVTAAPFFIQKHPLGIILNYSWGTGRVGELPSMLNDLGTLSAMLYYMCLIYVPTSFFASLALPYPVRQAKRFLTVFEILLLILFGVGRIAFIGLGSFAMCTKYLILTSPAFYFEWATIIMVVVITVQTIRNPSAKQPLTGTPLTSSIA